MVPSGGTPAFLAPEQFSDAFGEVSPATDVFGLGALSYYLMTGRSLYPSSTPNEALLNSISLNEIHFPELAAIPAEIMNLISNCLRKAPASRPQSIHDVLMKLQGTKTIC